MAMTVCGWNAVSPSISLEQKHRPMPITRGSYGQYLRTTLPRGTLRSTFNSRASSDTLSQLFIRSSAISRNALGYLLTRFLATLQLLSLPSVAIMCVSVSGVSPTFSIDKGKSPEVLGT
jgi:hypothetical protein